MIARTRWAARCRRLGFLAALLSLPAASGCHGIGNRIHEKHIPQYGCIDPSQPRELEMVSEPPYVVEPPDSLEINVRPPYGDLPSNPLIVQADGNIDLGFAGDVYVAGLTLAQVEQKISQQLMATAADDRPSKPYEVSVRVSDGSASKSFYVLGTVNKQARYPITGNDTVLDAILEAGLKVNSLPEKSYLVRPHPAGGPDQVLKIDWFGIRDRGDTLTNYQVRPGDRIIVPGGKPPSVLQSLLGGG